MISEPLRNSYKLRAAVAYHIYVYTQDPESHSIAVAWLGKAVGEWRKLVQVTELVYKPVPLMHYTHHRDDDQFHWSIVETEVKEELTWLKSQ